MQCDEDVDECQDATRCKNGGTCLNTPGSYSCVCAPGFTGNTCSNDINECASHPCFEGECRDEVNHFKCECREGYKGVICDEEEQSCAWSVVASAFLGIISLALVVHLAVYVYSKWSVCTRSTERGEQEQEGRVRYTASQGVEAGDQQHTYESMDPRKSSRNTEPEVYTNIALSST